MTITQTDDRPIVLTSGGPLADDLEAAATIAPATLSVPAAASAPTRPTFTITDAATACAVSRKTITRKLSDLADHGAAKDSDGVWRIPVEALLAVGLHPGRSLSRETGSTAAQVVSSPTTSTPGPDLGIETVTIPRDRWDDLRIRLARAEAEAAERALALADARLALRALTAGPATAPARPDALEPDPHHVGGSGAWAAPAQREPEAIPLPTPVELSATQDRTESSADGAFAPAPSAPTVEATYPTEADSAQVVATARTQAAQRGGYVPAAGTAPRKKRWWRSA